MNLKKAKKLRQYLRKMGVDVSQKEYNMIGGRVDKEGKLEITGTNVLVKGCGRKLYKTAKFV